MHCKPLNFIVNFTGTVLAIFSSHINGHPKKG